MGQVHFMGANSNLPEKIMVIMVCPNIFPDYSEAFTQILGRGALALLTPTSYAYDQNCQD